MPTVATAVQAAEGLLTDQSRQLLGVEPVLLSTLSLSMLTVPLRRVGAKGEAATGAFIQVLCDRNVVERAA